MGSTHRVMDFFAAHHRRQPFTGIAEVLDALDTWWLLAIIIAALLGGLWWSGRMVQAVYLGVSIVAALVLNPLLKLAFERPRPTADALVTVSSAAFPSGHTTTATTIATALSVIAWPTRWRWPVIAAAVVFSLAMGLSRVYLGVHWTSDVIGGWALGFTIAMGMRALMPWPSPEEAAAAQEDVRRSGRRPERPRRPQAGAAQLQSRPPQGRAPQTSRAATAPASTSSSSTGATRSWSTMACAKVR